ncbi:MAG: hypothetical protein HY591_02635, partial [Candidatus Omnitrophica bacterium]|nr:hypothetical protein [Candidatus Omnitrophota bacterium]
MQKNRFVDIYAEKVFIEVGESQSVPEWIDNLRGLFGKEDIWLSNFDVISEKIPPPSQGGIRMLWEFVGRGVKGIFYFIWGLSEDEPFYRHFNLKSPTFFHLGKDGNYKPTSELITLEENNKFLARYGNL